jgi:hypothetical protein
VPKIRGKKTVNERVKEFLSEFMKPVRLFAEVSRKATKNK